MKQKQTSGGGTSILDMPDVHTRPEPPAVLVSAREPVVPCPSCSKPTRPSLTNPQERVCTYEGSVYSPALQLIHKAGVA